MGKWDYGLEVYGSIGKCDFQIFHEIADSVFEMFDPIGTISYIISSYTQYQLLYFVLGILLHKLLDPLLDSRYLQSSFSYVYHLLLTLANAISVQSGSEGIACN